MNADATHRDRDDGGGGRAIEALVAPAIVARLHGLLKAVRLYDLSNQAVREPVAELLRLIGRVTDGEMVLVAMGQCFYVNGVRVRADPSQTPVFTALTQEFEQRRLGGVRFLEGLEAGELASFLRLLVEHPDAERASRLSEAAAGAGVVHVAPVTLDELQSIGRALDVEEGSAEGARARAQETFARAVRGTKGALAHAGKSGRPALRRVKRVVQPIVDTIMKNEYSIVGLTAIKNHDEYTYAHCVNVSILAVAMGQALGLDRAALANLGVAALLHDVGKLAVPTGILAKPGALDAAEWALMKRHPIEGVRMVARMPGLSELTLELLNVCLQHHRTVDGGGYPCVARPGRLAAASRIVAVADCYDAMTAHREYRRRPFSGHEALRLLLGPERGRHDPAVLWALVKTVGLYPGGTVLRASSGHLLLSLAGNPRDVRRPDVRVLQRPDGSMPPDDQPEIWSPMPSEVSVESVVPEEGFEGEIERLLAA
jgi:HD-GYP domain-containing protein (c-di-GMP phosphodiesterase class II)